MGSSPGGELSRLGVIWVKLIGWEFSWWGVALVCNRLTGSHPAGELSGLELSGGELPSGESSCWGIVRVGVIWWGIAQWGVVLIRASSSPFQALQIVDILTFLVVPEQLSFHRIILQPNYCPPTLPSLGPLPPGTTTHHDCCNPGNYPLGPMSMQLGVVYSVMMEILYKSVKYCISTNFECLSTCF